MDYQKYLLIITPAIVAGRYRLPANVVTPPAIL